MPNFRLAGKASLEKAIACVIQSQGHVQKAIVKFRVREYHECLFKAEFTLDLLEHALAYYYYDKL